MSAGEISGKLAGELLERLDRLERLCDRKAREGRSGRYDVDADWMAAGCMCHDLRQHIGWHLTQNADESAEASCHPAS